MTTVQPQPVLVQRTAETEAVLGQDIKEYLCSKIGGKHTPESAKTTVWRAVKLAEYAYKVCIYIFLLK